MFNSRNNVLFPVSRKLREWILSIRRHIHAHPELSFEEFETAKYIQDKLREHDIVSEGGIAGTGVAAYLPGPPERRRSVALRADMDALPIIEETDLPFSSKNYGIMHACGHDGHVAMLLGAAALLAEKKLPGPVKLLFQPAEENGNGAQRCIDAGVLENVEAIFSGHIDTHHPLGTITADEGIVCAWADSFIIRLRGKSGHAARPHEAVDPVVAAANLVLAVQTLISRGVDPNKAAVITIGCLQAGCAQNIIARDALLKGTIRSTHCRSREATMEGLLRVTESIGRMYEVEVSLDFNDSIPAVVNDSRSVEIARVAASRTEGVLAAVSQGDASLGAEDFACYQQKIPGCMVRFGASGRKKAGVAHSGSFDFDEDVLAIGASWYANAAWQWLNRRYDMDSKNTRSTSL